LVSITVNKYIIAQQTIWQQQNHCIISTYITIYQTNWRQTTECQIYNVCIMGQTAQNTHPHTQYYTQFQHHWLSPS